MTDQYGQNGPSSVPPQGVPPQGVPPQQPQNPYAPGAQPQTPYVQGQPQNPYPQGQPQNPYVQGQPQNPYPQGQPQNPYATPAAAPGMSAKTAKGLGALSAVAIRIIIGVVIALVAAFVIFIVKPGASGAKVGDCLAVTGSASDPEAKIVSCDASSAAYKVTAVGAACDEYEDEFTYSKKGTTISKLCLTYNVKVGDCITVSSSGAGDTKGECTAGTYKVLLTKEGTSDETACPAGTTATLPNTTRNTLICLAKQ